MVRGLMAWRRRTESGGQVKRWEAQGSHSGSSAFKRCDQG